MSFFKYPLKTVVTSDYITWSGDMVLAQSALDALFWIYNQVVAPWLIMVMILAAVPKRNMFFLYAICYLHGPFVFIGFFPFIAIMVIKSLFSNGGDSKTLIDKIMPYLSFQNIVAAPLILLISYLYLSGSQAVQALSIAHINIVKYISFTTLSFGIISVLIINKYKREPFFYVTVFLLLFLPLISMGTLQPFTFSARVSLVPQFILMLLVTRYILEEGKTLLKRLVVVYVVLGAIEPVLELGRSVVFTVGYYIDPLAMNTYLLHRTTLYNDRVSLLPVTNDLKNANYLILNYNETIDRPMKMYDLLPPQKDSTFFKMYLLKK